MQSIRLDLRYGAQVHPLIRDGEIAVLHTLLTAQS